MKSYVRIIALTLLCLLFPQTTFSAEIKKRNGQVIEGDIEGTLVQKGKGWQLKEGRNLEHAYSYMIVNGKGIESIDETGIRTSKDGMYLLWTISARNRALSDAEVFRLVKSHLEKGGFDPSGFNYSQLANDTQHITIAYPAHKKDRGVVVAAPIIIGAVGGDRGSLLAKKTIEIQAAIAERFNANSADAKALASWNDKLIGELSGGVIIPVIRLKTDKGIVTIPVAEIVAFGEKQ